MSSRQTNGSNKKQCTLKIVLLGDSAVGKSSIATRYIVGKFQSSNATIGAAFLTKTVDIDENKQVTLELWDTAGQERYRSLTPIYYRGTDVAIIVYDVNSPISLTHAQSWIDELKSYIESEREASLRILLVGNKLDLNKEFQPSGELVDQSEFGNFLVSAKTGEGISEMFGDIIANMNDDLFEQQNNSKEVIPLEDNAGSSFGSCAC